MEEHAKEHMRTVAERPERVEHYSIRERQDMQGQSTAEIIIDTLGGSSSGLCPVMLLVFIHAGFLIRKSDLYGITCYPAQIDNSLSCITLDGLSFYISNRDAHEVLVLL